jgi:hypothetical protein
VAASVVGRDALLRYPEVQRALVKEAMSFYKLWGRDREELHERRRLSRPAVQGAGGARFQPLPAPSRDVRQLYRERCRRMLLETGVPGVPPA